LGQHMVSTRTCVRLLKHLGVALIFAPEPFTTPFGVAFVLAARHLSKRHEARVNNRLREAVQYYLAHTGHSSDYADGESGASVPVKRRGLNAEHPILGQITGSRSLGADANGSVAHSAWTTTSSGVKGATQHSVNVGSLAQHYGTGNIGQPKAKPHATKTTQRRHYYGSDVSSTAVLSALRTNNHYYEVLSRKNVIGGY